MDFFTSGRILPYQLLLTFLALLSFIPEIHGGSPCPPRASIYPCMCTEIPKSRNSIFTVIMCSHISSTSVLSGVMHAFKTMHIDRFILVDSFLETQDFGKEADEHQRLPQNWLSHIRIHETEIIDSQLSPCFACDFTEACRNSLQTHFSVTNSSLSDKLCTVCQLENQMKFSWISCLSHLKHFHFRHNKLESIEMDFFPLQMKDLLEVNMSSNMISKLGRDAFKNLPKLVKLDLSHNMIKDISDRIFGDTKMNLKLLDLSWNQIVTISPNILKLTPNLRFLNLENNLIQKVEEKTWKYMSPEVRILNLSGNLVNCDCCLTWLNSSLKTWTVVQGNCASPSEYLATPLRRASRFLVKKCDDTSINHRCW